MHDRISISLPQDQAIWVAEEATRRGLTTSGLIQQLIRAAIREERNRRISHELILDAQEEQELSEEGWPLRGLSVEDAREGFETLARMWISEPDIT